MRAFSIRVIVRKISAVILNIRASRINLKRTVNTDPRYCLRGGRGMLLSHRTSVKIRPEYSNIIGHMCYAASKLWNICNYERHHYKELGLEKYPDWYYQKKTHKGNLWYKLNILRKYLSVSGKQKELSLTGLKKPDIIKVAA